MTSRARSNPVYVVTCGLCGQSWQRMALNEGDALDCIFCGTRGRLALGVIPAEPGAEGVRIEAWLLHAWR